MAINKYRIRAEYTEGYADGWDDAYDGLELNVDVHNHSEHYIRGYKDGYSDVEPQQFTEEGPVANTQESEFDTVANAMTGWTPGDLSRMAYWALDLLHNTTGLTKEMDKCIGLAKIELELLQQIINDRD